MQSNQVELNGDVTLLEIIESQLASDTITLHYSDLKAMNPIRGCKVKLVSSK